MNKMYLLTLLLGGALFFSSAPPAECQQNDNSGLTFSRSGQHYVVDPATGKVSVYNTKGELLEIFYSPDSRAEEQTPSLPPTVVNFLFLGKGSVSGMVWNDLNGNRQIDPMENAIAGVRVYIDSNHDGSYSEGEPTIFSDGNGFYSFARVSPGITEINVDAATLPPGYEFTTPHPKTLTLARKQVVSDADFGVRHQVISASLEGSIRDRSDNTPVAGVRVFVDLNNDDSFTTNEPNVTTDVSGRYHIADIPAGTYKVHVDNTTLNATYHRTPVEGANPTLFTFAAGTTLTLNLVYIHKATICGTLVDADGRLWEHITLFVDLNNNDTFDPGEPLAATDDSGHYCFDELFPGTYTILLIPRQLPAGYDLASPGEISVKEGENATADFQTTAQPVTVNGFVWDDKNNDAIKGQNEKGLAGIVVFVDANNNATRDNGEPFASTNPAGAYSLTGLKYGETFLRVEDGPLLKAYIHTTFNPVQRTFSPGETYGNALFGFQRKLEPVQSLHLPTRLHWRNGNLYVSDNANNSVFILDNTLKISGELKNLARPLAVTADDAGNIYVGNQNRKNIEVYDDEGTFIKTIGNGNIVVPNDLALDRDRNLYVMDTANHTVLIFDKDGNFVRAIGDSQQIGYGVSIAIAYRADGGSEVGELYVADQTNCTIHVFTLDGTFEKSMGICGDLTTTNWDGKFAGLLAVATDRYGNVHGLDNSLHVVQVFEPENGTFLRSYNAYLPHNAANLNLNSDIAIHPADDRVVVTNMATNNVEPVAIAPAP